MGRLPLREAVLAVSLLALLLAPGLAQDNGAISFVQSTLVVNEGTGSSDLTTVQIPMIREGGTNGLVFAGISITDGGADFLTNSAVVSFSDGVASSSATLVVVDDNLPEGNETFTITIVDARNGATVGFRNTLTLTIQASDEPFGTIQFFANSLAVSVDEPLSDPTDVQLTVTRGPGLFGRITVNYQVSAGAPGSEDLSVYMGLLEFDDQVSSQPLTLTILPDDLPENDELFTVQLLSPMGGASLATSGVESILTINSNDVPISWSQMLVEVSEESGTVQLNLTRGQLQDGSQVGPTSQPSTVTVTTRSGSASAGVDFTGVSTSITFSPGVTSLSVPVQIIDDSIGEGDQTFTVELSSPSTDAVIVPPSIITVVISVNDNAGGFVSFASPGPVIIREDSGEVARLTVQREMGTFGELTVDWQIMDNINEQLASDDFQPPSGTLTIPDGAQSAVLEITAFDDSLAEVAEGFSVELVRVVSGDGMLSETGVRVASLIVAESDDVYGLVEWGNSLTVAPTIPRELRLVVSRSHGDIGTVSVDYTVTYLPSAGDPVVMATSVVQLQGGQSVREFSVTITDTMFLESSASFRVELTNTTLVGGATLLIPSAVSPSIGPRSLLTVPIPDSAANGLISFHPNSITVFVEEPPVVAAEVVLNVSRSGSYGEDVITWNITPLSADLTDIGGTSGTLTIPAGDFSAQLEVTLLPDTTPETDELFLVSLVATDSGTGRLLANQAVSTVTIGQNDAASGIFSIDPSTAGPFLVEESSDGVVTIAIRREQGALTEEFISYSIPGAGAEILGGQGIEPFAVGQREALVTLLVNDDNVPETNETFVFEISSLQGNSEIIGSRSSVVITVLANDEYAGVFSFTSSSLDQTAVEPVAGESSTVQYTVQRERGTFTAVTVHWQVTGGDSDVELTSGSVLFPEESLTASFSISILPDNLPEGAEVLTVGLLPVDGPGALASSDTQTQLTIAANDDPINFRGSFMNAAEGSTVQLTLERGGQALGTSDVTFTVDYSSAFPSDITISPVSSLVSFTAGVREAQISIEVLADGEPEENEFLTVRLVSVTGDSVIGPPSQFTVLILPSDDPNGVFQFESPSEQAAEGDALSLTVERLAGDFGTVTLSWTVYQLEGGSRLPTAVTDVSPTTGILTFSPFNDTEDINLRISDDSTPELAERFEIALEILNIDGDSQGARIGDMGSLVLTIGPSDDPYGLLAVSADYVEVAEDVPIDDPSLGSLALNVQRGSGDIGEISVSWEILTEAVPSYLDLLLIGEAVGGVTTAQPRPSTGTRALTFPGAVGDLVSISPLDQPAITDQLAISLWLRLNSGTSGVLVDQLSYRLSLIADSANFILRFSYQTSGGGVLSVETSVAQSALSDGNWHSLVLTVSNQIASFYSDGFFLTSRSLSSAVLSGRGSLTTGGVVNSISPSDFLTGDLQDVRVFNSSLTTSQVAALSTDTAALAIAPISGYLSYSAGVTMAIIQASSLDDSDPEPSQQFVVQLASTVGGARIDPAHSTATLNILKSDSSNGVFAFDTLSAATSEGSTLSLTVTRGGGLFGGVTLNWRVTQNGLLADDDFSPSSGSVFFSPAQQTNTIQLAAVDELVPELVESFVVSIVSVVADDNQTSSTPSSGASIDPSASQSFVTIDENDSPFGLLQLSTSPPIPGPPALQTPEVFIEESVGSLTVYVVRAQGRLGNVSVEYLTSEGSALSGEGEPDFVSTAGSLSFSGDVLVQSFAVSILDNELPELQKTFYVNLTNPAGSSGSPDLGSSLIVHILPSDDAFGLFNFASGSLSLVTAELGAVSLTVLREGGQFGRVSVYWNITDSVGASSADISPSSGTLEFLEGDVQANIELTILDDLSAELAEVFTVTLLNATVGAGVGSLNSAVITVEASDHPYGLFTFLPTSGGLTEGSEVTVTLVREFGTVGQVEVGVASVGPQDPRLSSLNLDLSALEQSSELATPGMDYTPIQTVVTFEPGQSIAQVTLSISQDDEPELRELLFLVLTSVALNTSSLDSVDTSVPPLPAPGNGSTAVLEIRENDDARGRFVLSQVAVSVGEPSEQVLSIVRQGGTFGEVSVSWEAVPITATSLDYTPAADSVTFLAGEVSKPLSLVVIDDTLPEFSEQFVIRLLSVSSPASLGVVAIATVTIEASDDPNGALEFVVDNLEIAEPDSAPAVATFTVQRVGGAVGVVEVSWSLINQDGSPAGSDVLPTSNTLQFVSNSVQQVIRLSVLPDDSPELTEVFVLSLANATGGARVEQSQSTATLTIPSNDSPHGELSFAMSTSVAMEAGDNGSSIAMVPIIRRFGSFGSLTVSYSVGPADAGALAIASGTPLLDFYSAPLSDTGLLSSPLQLLTATVEGCAGSCISNQACRAFTISGSDCRLYVSTTESQAAIGTDYYEKIESLVQPFYQAVATEGNDFSPVAGGTLTIPDGVGSGAVPVTIIGDPHPELNESLVVRLVSVQLQDPSLSPGGPSLGAITTNSLVILENDDPRGRFAITSSNGNSVTRVSESDNFNFGVSLIVERQGGTLGEVSVQWSVVDSSAVEGADYTGTGAVLTFPDGDSRESVALTILADDLPEKDETIQIVLSNPMGGASIGDMGTTLVIIEANDQAGGLVGFDPLSRSAVIAEGETGGVRVVRRVGSFGEVELSWIITTADGQDPTQEFVTTSGTASFQEGENATEIVVSVRADPHPELEERFSLEITAVNTLSSDVSPSGHAQLDPQTAVATITIQASDNPHGQVEFQTTVSRLPEGGAVGVAIIRQFGLIGVIEVAYEVVAGSVRPLLANETTALPGVDFVAVTSSLLLVDGQQSATIPVSIIDDSDPEFDELLIVRLLSVTLVGVASPAFPPTVGPDNVTEVIIPANDSPQGEMTFQQNLYEITEDVGTFQLPILRVQGTAGQVSVVYFVTNGLAINGQDFIVPQLQEVEFAPGTDQMTVSVQIVNDGHPEIAEQFCVQLQLPRAGAVLGNITTTCVTIAANDDAYGVFSFDSSSLSATIQETIGMATDNNVAELIVRRSGGTFGQITVPFEIRSSATGELTSDDLSPSMGSALVFNQEDSFRVLRLEALEDSAPELDEVFTVTLLPPVESGRLDSTDTMATITVAANQNPYGVFELSVVGGIPSVEEDSVLVNFELLRDFGTFGEVSVTMATNDETATFVTGTSLVYSAFQSLSGGMVWHSVGDGLLVLGGPSDAQLLAWRGVFTAVQTLPGEQVTAVESFSPEAGLELLMVGNGGLPGNRELTVDVYQFTGPERVSLNQSLPSVGVRDLVTFSREGTWYVLVVNSEGNDGSTTVDSTLWTWTGGSLQLTQNLQTFGGSSVDVFTLSDTLYAVVGSLTASLSQVYEWRSGEFRLLHSLEVPPVQDVLFVPPASLLLAADSLLLMTYSQASGEFVLNSTLNAVRPIKLEYLSGEVFVTNLNSPAQTFTHSSGLFTENTRFSLPTSSHIYPFTLNSETFLASAGSTRSVVMETLSISASVTDYYTRSTVLRFLPGESVLRFSVRIVNDNLPEIDERFSVELSEAVGGASIGSSGAVSIDILTNDNAHGLIGFSDESLSVIVEEGELDSNISLAVVREGGVFGHVTVAWEVSGAHDAGEITPTQGTVMFPNGESRDVIQLQVQADGLPELNEVTFVTLTQVLQNGVSEEGDASDGAIITPGRDVAAITVAANDAPHGVVSWTTAVLQSSEVEGLDSAVSIALIRELGSTGAIVINYSTYNEVGAGEEATPLLDYVPVTSEVVMAAGARLASVDITILQDDLAELTESFFVNITSVRLVDEADRQGSESNSPRVGQPAVVQVQILENDDSRGSLSFVDQTITVEEVIGGVVRLEVRRSGGTFGSVGAEFTAVGVSASSVDFDPASGTVMFDSGAEVSFIEITIVNDPDPEMDETFEVRLVGGVGGANIAEPSLATVTILSNDDINGVFSFTDGSLLFLIPESTSPSDPMGVVTLTVQRSSNFVGVVTVYWAVGADGVADLEPTSGNLTFDTTTLTQSFQVRAINDGLPELFEAFSVSLLHTEGGGRIVDPREARIAIQSSNDPSGVIGFTTPGQVLVASEGEEFSVGVTRTFGTEGTVTLTWAISPPDSTVFRTTTDTVVMTNGQADTSFNIQVLTDSVPEIARAFSLDIVSSSLAGIDVNATMVTAIVAASDYPHGVLEFSSPTVTVEEGEAGGLVTVTRGLGVVGDLRVNFDLQLGTADNSDFNISSLSLTIPSGQSQASLSLSIFDDSAPETSETFSLSIATFSLVSTELRDFVFTGDSSLIDQPPILGTNSVTMVTIQPSDDPFGSITLSQSTYSAEEGAAVNITVTRAGGILVTARATYSTSDGQAQSPSDYTPSSGTLEFPPGSNVAFIIIPITDDILPEFEEDFVVTLTGSTAADLGPISAATVIISASDSPFGEVGFEPSVVSAGIRVPNPTLADGPQEILLNINRNGGLSGSTEITFQVMRNGELPRDDVSPVTAVVMFADGQASGQISIDVLPSDQDEVEETYTVSLVLASNNVYIVPGLASVSITVEQRGSPFGLVSFVADVLTEQTVSEGDTLVLPITRTGSANIEITVNYIVNLVTGSGPVSQDVAPVSGFVSMPSGVSLVQLELSVVRDGVPELSEGYSVVLTGTDSTGLTVDSFANTAPFSIRSSDSPYGLFSLSGGTITVDSTQPLVSRTLHYTIERGLGQVGDITVTITNSHTDSSEYVPASVTRVLAAGSTSLALSLPIASGAYLAPGSEFTSTITSAVVSMPSGQSADLSATPLVTVVSPAVSNTLISFTTSSLSATVNDVGDLVGLIVQRVGVLDTVNVQWSSGPLSSGSISPPSGLVTLTPDQETLSITLTATPSQPHGPVELFSISLSVQSQTSNFPARVDENADTAIIEPWGVLQLGALEFSGIEGNIVSVSIWRRFGSTGEITVTGLASMASSIPANQIAATGGVDFPLSPQSVSLADGQTTGYINISLPDNSATSPVKVFTFTLSQVARTLANGNGLSPRLAVTNLVATVAIVDDEGGSGVFSVSPNSASVPEGGVLFFSVVRSLGSAGEVGVSLRSVDRGAVAGEDYTGLSGQLVFADGETERVLSLPVLDDTVPEPDEGFTVELTPGAGAIVDPTNGVLSVTIPASDNPGGVFSISTASPLTLTDGVNPSEVISLTRTGGLIERVTISWETQYADSAQQEPLGSFLSATSGQVNFLPGQTQADNVIQLSLIPNAVPVGGVSFLFRISSASSGAVLDVSEITVVAQPRTVALFEVLTRSQVVTSPGQVPVSILRTDGLQLLSTVLYHTNTLNRPPAVIGELTFELAQPGVHFAQIENAPVQFAAGVEQREVGVSVISVPPTPRAFYVDITVQGESSVSDTGVVLIMPSGPLSELYSLYFQSLTISSVQQLESVSESLAAVVGGVSGADRDQSSTLQLILDQLISTASSLSLPSNTYLFNMLDTFDAILTDPSFSGQSLFVQSLKNFAYGLVEDAACPLDNTEVLEPYTRSGFYLEALKIRPRLLANRQFVATASNDYVQFPSQPLSTSQACVTVHFIEFLNNGIFGQPTFSSIVLSVGVANRDVQLVSGDPLRMRLHTSQDLGAIAESQDCQQWSYPSPQQALGQWSAQSCSPETQYGNVLLEDVLCSCTEFGDLAAAANITLGYSWTWPAAVSAGMVALIMALVMLVHLCYLPRTQLVTRIFICLCLAVFLFQLMLLIDVFASRSPTLSPDGCVALGALLHFTIILQFVWIVAMAVALWINFMGFTDGREPLVVYVIVSWGVAIVVVVATILIGRFAVPLSNTQLYFHTNAELCFIPDLGVSLVSVVVPVVLAMLLVVALLSHSCIYWSRWEDYHNMYHDSFNRTEIPLLLVFFALIFFTGLAGYLHMYIHVVYTFAFFIALNTVQGIYALVVYCFVSWHTLTRKHKKFVLGDEVEPLSLPEEPDYLASMSDLTTSRHKMDPQEEWANDSEITPVVGVGINRLDNGDDDSQDESHLDDLMFMLKTQSYPSEGGQATPTRPKGAEHLEMRRISIADTHL